jgi:hypothetical protein
MIKIMFVLMFVVSLVYTLGVAKCAGRMSRLEERLLQEV